MKVIWDPKAKKNRSQVADYIRQKFGARRKILFLQEVREVTKKLRTAPYIGKIDPLFEDRTISANIKVIGNDEVITGEIA